MNDVEVVVAHQERATLRVGDVFLEVDADLSRADTEIRAMALAPVPTPEVLWHRPPVLALGALPGRALARLGEPSTASPAAWVAAGAAARAVHEAPLPPWPGRGPDEIALLLDSACAWLLAEDLLPAEVVRRNRRLAEAALRPWRPVFVPGDLQVAHVFVDGDVVTGVLDWSEAGPGDALFDLAALTIGAPGAPRRRRRRLRRRCRPGCHPGVVIAAEPADRPLAGRARLRPGSRGRPAQLAALRRGSSPVS